VNLFGEWWHEGDDDGNDKDDDDHDDIMKVMMTAMMTMMMMMLLLLDAPTWPLGDCLRTLSRWDTSEPHRDPASIVINWIDQ